MTQPVKIDCIDLLQANQLFEVYLTSAHPVSLCSFAQQIALSGISPLRFQCPDRAAMSQDIILQH